MKVINISTTLIFHSSCHLFILTSCDHVTFQHLTSVLENKSDMVYELERICRLAMKVYVEMRIERITRLTVADDLGKSIFTYVTIGVLTVL